MDIQELRKVPHLSASGTSAYIECGLLFKLSRIDKVEPGGRADALELGSVIHEALAEFHQERMIGITPSLEELLEVFETLWREAAEESDEIEYAEGKDFGTLLEMGKGLLKAYYEKVSNDFKVLAIEEPFRFEVEGVPIIGVIDLIEEDPNGAIIIVDFKTSSKAYAAADVDKNLQLTVYSLAMKANGFADREILLRLDVLIKTKKPKFEQYWTTRTETDERRAKRKIVEVWKGISQGVFVPNDTTWKCGYCGYKSYCDEWFEAE